MHISNQLDIVELETLKRFLENAIKDSIITDIFAIQNTKNIILKLESQIDNYNK